MDTTVTFNILALRLQSCNELFQEAKDDAPPITPAQIEAFESFARVGNDFSFTLVRRALSHELLYYRSCLHWVSKALLKSTEKG